MPNYCDHFWGSHGCLLGKDLPHSVHQCLIGPERRVCSEMVVRSRLFLEEFFDKKFNYTYTIEHGLAAVRFYYLSGEWGEWYEDWTWHANHPDELEIGERRDG